MKSSLRDNFCSSPWFHVRINPAGYYVPCRWASEWLPEDGVSDYHVSDYSLKDYMNSPAMRDLRMTFLSGSQPKICQGCYYEDSHNKVSGRHKQLLKSGIQYVNFDKTLCSSPHWDDFEYSLNNQGASDHAPTDLQIDLGNTCNSACIMCNPTYSSRLAQEYKKLNQLAPNVFPVYQEVKNWADNDLLVDQFIQGLKDIQGIKYIHFLGGETLYLKSFYKICRALIDSGHARDIIVGTTTNGTIYNSELENIIKEFKEFHLGISIETVDSLNDYIRYPADTQQVLGNIHKFISLRDSSNLQITLRITPNIFSIYRLPDLFDFMYTHKVIAESCNILSDPSCLRFELLPGNLKQQVLTAIDQVIQKHSISPNETIINRRREDLVEKVISNLIYEYKHFLENLPEITDSASEHRNLVEFIQSFEKLRGNRI